MKITRKRGRKRTQTRKRFRRLWRKSLTRKEIKDKSEEEVLPDAMGLKELSAFMDY